MNKRPNPRQALTIGSPVSQAGNARPLPRFKVILLNDDVNDFGDVVRRVHDLTPLSRKEAVERATEAHQAGQSLLLVTHWERAELYREQFKSLVPPIGIELDPEA